MFMHTIGLALAVCTLGAIAQEPQDVPSAESLTQAFEQARKEWFDAYAKANRANDADARSALLANRPERAFLPRFERAARAWKGKAQAVPYLVWIVRHAEREVVSKAMETITADHLDDPGIRLAVARLGGLHGQLGLEATRRWLDRIIEGNPHVDVVTQARFTRAALYVGTRAAMHDETTRLFAIAELRTVLEGAPSNSLKGLAERLLFEAEHLEPGLPAPEIEGEDLDGVAFKLSDYRGKVVLLDFWGDW